MTDSQIWLAVVSSIRTWATGGNTIKLPKVAILAGYPQPE
jgi:hypothetical protein